LTNLEKLRSEINRHHCRIGTSQNAEDPYRQTHDQAFAASKLAALRPAQGYFNADSGSADTFDSPDENGKGNKLRNPEAVKKKVQVPYETNPPCDASGAKKHDAANPFFEPKLIHP